jgi:A/G-specific adenine glycosylase
MQDALIAWSRETRRDLPWRRTRDPWAVLVSELMLQQTQVARVVPKYEGFLARFPTVAACAAASVGDVIHLWAGLGYNRRAVNLHRAAVIMGDRVPDSLDELLALPGVGPYTARAVLTFAYERDVGVLDVNASRSLSRLSGGRVTQTDADAMVPAGSGWAWNQAVLDLGATVCTARPQCQACPVAIHCTWRRRGGADPALAARPQAPFEGSFRQRRGRLLDALRRGPVVGADARVADSLVADGLAAWSGRELRLP